jgi:DNA-binding MarR family transcriptional regulator
MRVSTRDVRAVQAHYPQIYLACHTRHPRRPSTAEHVSANDSMILGHLDTDRGMRTGVLARHLGIVPSTLSAAVKRLAAQGYVVRTRDGADQRAIGLRLSAAGARAMQGGSVLDSRRVAAMLSRLTAPERARALVGLTLLARASRALNARAASPGPVRRRRFTVRGGAR